MQLKVIRAALCAFALLPIAGVHAQSYPNKPVKIITPFPAGSGPDAAMRLIGDKLSRAWGQQVLIENRPGANGFIATGLLAPKGTPSAIVERINRDVAKAVVEPDVRERFAGFGYAAWPLSPAAMTAAIEAEVRRYADTIARLNLQLD